MIISIIHENNYTLWNIPGVHEDLLNMIDINLKLC